jgi:hypothetical protein
VRLFFPQISHKKMGTATKMMGWEKGKRWSKRKRRRGRVTVVFRPVSLNLVENLCCWLGTMEQLLRKKFLTSEFGPFSQQQSPSMDSENVNYISF